MDKKYEILIICAAILVLCFVGTASAKTWYVDDDGGVDFRRIQDAINNATDGDTIIVKEGNYSENIKVDKSLTIRSENGSDSTIVHAKNPDDHVFNVEADYVNISYFTVKGASYPRNAGIQCGADHCYISNNNVSNNYYGIYLDCSSNNTLTNNTISGNDYNFGIAGTDISDFIHNIDTSNKVEGKPIYYWINEQDQKIPNDAGFVGLVNSTNILVKDLTLTKNDYGVLLAYSNNSLIENVTSINNRRDGIYLHYSNSNILNNNSVSDNSNGIHLCYSSNNNITNNNANSNEDGFKGITFTVDGIFLSYSNNNTIMSNTANFNGNNGIHLRDSSNNKIINNTARSNDDGIVLFASRHNSLIGNNARRNEDNGIFLDSSAVCSMLRDNRMSFNRHNFVVRAFLPCNDIDTSNLVDGKPIYYLVGTSDLIIDSSSNAGVVYCINCDNITVKNQTLTSNEYGIYFYNTSNSRIQNNHISNNYIGIYLWRSRNNIIEENSISSNQRGGLSLRHSSKSTIVNNNVLSNKPDPSPYRIIYVGHIGYGIELDSSDNCFIANNEVKNNWDGIYLEHSSNSILANNYLYHSHFIGTHPSGYCNGIELQDSDNSIIRDNTAVSNEDGIEVYDSNNCTVTNNTVRSNEYGIKLHDANNCIITNNKASHNSKSGIGSNSSSDNVIYRNNFINNRDNSYSSDSTNIWSSEEKITYIYNGTSCESYLGNYWGNYEEIYPDAEETDITGIWDTPYSIDGGEDNYPLMMPFENFIKPKTAFESAVEYAQPNYIRKALIRLGPISPPKYTPKPAGVPNDPFWDEQYNLRLINVDDAWKLEKGDKRIKIAIVDTGVQYDHPDLKSNYVSGGYDWVNDDSYPYDDHGHGTYCAGIAATVMNNKKGIAGIAQVSLMAEKVLDENKKGYDMEDFARGIRHAVDEGAKIICLSYGGDFSYREKSACQYAWDSGCLLIAGSGNTGTRSIEYPAGYDTVIAVGAIDKNKRRWSDSNYGPELELVAPGVDVISTHLDDSLHTGYAQGSGTSGAVPHVAGIAALLWSRCPSLTNQQIRDMLKESAIDLGASGWDAYYGYGMVNANVVYKIIYVPDDYTTIQGAVDAASHGDIIIVRDGIYTENIAVNKPLTIRSENGPTKCIVRAENSRRHVFAITADYVNISGFTAEAEVYTVTDNIFNIEFQYPQFPDLPTQISSDVRAAGIYLQADYCNVSNNKCPNNDYGIYLKHSNNNKIISNYVNSNGYHGITLWSSSNNMLLNNHVSENTDVGIFLTNSSNNNELRENTASTYNQVGIVLKASYSNILTNNTAKGNREGIRLESSSNNNRLTNNIASSNYQYGIVLSFSCNNNTLTNNTANRNSCEGIYLYSSNYNALTSNIANSNDHNGILLYNSSNNNRLTNNNANLNNQIGIVLYFSSNNKIYLNNFANNTDNFYSFDSTNIWNSEEKITYIHNGTTYESYMGNYWDDYEEKYPDAEEIDATGIWDTPYSIDGDKDNYPLMMRFENY